MTSGFWDKTHQEVRCEGCNAMILIRVRPDGTFTTLHKCEPALSGVWKGVRA